MEGLAFQKQGLFIIIIIVIIASEDDDDDYPEFKVLYSKKNGLYRSPKS